MRWVRGLGITEKITAYALTIVSAAFYAASFLCELCWFFSFFSLSPLFLTRFSSWRVAFLNGFLWGVIAYTAVLSALLDVMWRLGNGLHVVWYLVAFVIYFAVFSGFWFFAAQILALIIRSWHLAWLITSFAYWAWMQIGFFYFITGRLQGYGLALPFVPVMEYSAFLLCLPVIRWWGMLIVVLMFHLAIAHKKWWLITLGLLFFGGSYWYALWHKQEEREIKNIVKITGGFASYTPYERAHEICEKLLEGKQKNPQAVVFVLPESAFPYPLNEHTYALEMWSSNGNLHEKYLIIGTHYACRECRQLHNSACVIYQGRVIYRYDKCGMLPFFEEEIFDIWLSPFLRDKKEMRAGCKQESIFVIPEVGPIKFYICSELLWNLPTDKKVIGLVHDGHYRYAYFPRLFKCYGYMRALEGKSELIYCGWR